MIAVVRRKIDKDTQLPSPPLSPMGTPLGSGNGVHNVVVHTAPTHTFYSIPHVEVNRDRLPTWIIVSSGLSDPNFSIPNPIRQIKHPSLFSPVSLRPKEVADPIVPIFGVGPFLKCSSAFPATFTCWSKANVFELTPHSTITKNQILHVWPSNNNITTTRVIFLIPHPHTKTSPNFSPTSE